MNCSLPLRDRKKAATRTALSNAALRLARTVGVDAVTAEAVATEAGVSTRTFHNYFTSKEEAILYRFETEAKVWAQLLRARPADEPIWESLEQLSLNLITDPARTLDETVAVMALVEDSPALMTRKVEMSGRVARIIGEAIAERTGTDIDADLYPNLVQMAAAAACKSAIELWLRGTSSASSPEELVSQAFRQLRAGLPPPTAAATQS
ncbi:TetR family transcriptional regulator [Rhodococcus kronopolitis]|uniref:TetR family transcriptional regulator n=1 Tax=Rhodococcus kronopolitis TaxID=1460226 RepID=A0ABV9FMV8_9NOCA